MAKKKILLLSDDLRMHSGIATQSRTFVTNTLHKYDWCQIAGAIKHPDEGKVMDMNESLEKDLGIKEESVKEYNELNSFLKSAVNYLKIYKQAMEYRTL